MKIIVPLEIRIQQKGEEYDDGELIRDAIEVRALKLDLAQVERSLIRLAYAFMASSIVLMALSVCYCWESLH